MKEYEIESALCRAVQNIGGWCLKWESPGCTGVPDRIILLPGGHILFAETKVPGKHERPRQAYIQNRLANMGFPVYSTVDCPGKIAQIVVDCLRLMDTET